MRVFLLFAGLLLPPSSGHRLQSSVSVDAGLFSGMRNIHVGYDLDPRVNFDNGLNIGLKMRF
ncbi:MAG: hypothetical protein IIA98_01175 [Proteobacteria bacterium]|nr:hypothetical protein [Pseudomonadota bacterium]